MFLIFLLYYPLMLSIFNIDGFGIRIWALLPILLWMVKPPLIRIDRKGDDQ